MLGKLLKHDLRSVWRLWWLIIPIAPMSVLICILSMRFSLWNDVDSAELLLLQFMALGFFAVGVAMMTFCVIATYILTHYRFYKNLFSDEGYLTFTLPVSRRDILLSKTLNSLIWHVGLIALFVCSFAVFGIFLDVDGKIIGLGLYIHIKDLFVVFLEMLGVWLIVYIVELMALSFAFVFIGIATIQLCITVGATIVKKAKLLVGIIIYHVISYFASSIGGAFYWWLIFTLSTGSAMLTSDIPLNLVLAIMAMSLLIVIVAVITLAFCIYFATRNIIERKLNLA